MSRLNGNVRGSGVFRFWQGFVRDVEGYGSHMFALHRAVAVDIPKRLVRIQLITIPTDIAKQANEEAQIEARALGEMCGVTIEGLVAAMALA